MIDPTNPREIWEHLRSAKKMQSFPTSAQAVEYMATWEMRLKQCEPSAEAPAAQDEDKDKELA